MNECGRWSLTPSPRMQSQPVDQSGGPAVAADVLVAALEAVEQPVWLVDTPGLIWFANRAAVAALGYSDAGQLLVRQRAGRELRRQLQDRADPRSRLALTLPARVGDRRLRRLVQQRPFARSARRPAASGVRGPGAAGSGRPTGRAGTHRRRPAAAPPGTVRNPDLLKRGNHQTRSPRNPARLTWVAQPVRARPS